MSILCDKWRFYTFHSHAYDNCGNGDDDDGDDDEDDDDAVGDNDIRAEGTRRVIMLQLTRIHTAGRH